MGARLLAQFVHVFKAIEATSSHFLLRTAFAARVAPSTASLRDGVAKTTGNPKSEWPSRGIVAFVALMLTPTGSTKRLVSGLLAAQHDDLIQPVYMRLRTSNQALKTLNIELALWDK
ncbi:hypothetical protein E4U41_001093 [Claviceps citrina]|nr:hypothetical protein E4U41_001093 [Claviceps citrina]